MTKMKYLSTENGSERSYGELWNQENKFRTKGCGYSSW